MLRIVQNPFLRVSRGWASWKIMNKLPSVVAADKLLLHRTKLKTESYCRVWILETNCERGHWKIIYTYWARIGLHHSPSTHLSKPNQKTRSIYLWVPELLIIRFHEVFIILVLDGDPSGDSEEGKEKYTRELKKEIKMLYDEISRLQEENRKLKEEPQVLNLINIFVY